MGFLPSPFDTPIFGMDPNWVYGILFGSLAILLIIRFSYYPIKSILKNKSEEKNLTKTKTEDKVRTTSMDDVKTKEEHAMGEKTHD